MVCTLGPRSCAENREGGQASHTTVLDRWAKLTRTRQQCPERQVTLELYNRRIALEGFWKEEIASMYIFLITEVMCNLYVYVYYTVIKLGSANENPEGTKISCISSVS